STECHNQDKVSMGTIASRDAMRVLQLTEQVLATTLLATVQGLRIRIERKELDLASLPVAVQAMYNDICSFFEPLVEDRPMESLLRFTIDAIQTQRWALYQ
ncbi:MAG: aromatic amino acid lyase, partial [Moritella sp.]